MALKNFSSYFHGIDDLDIGSALSDFQSSPFCHDEAESFVPRSDWEYELLKNLQGNLKKLKHQQVKENLPKFLQRFPLYLKRSKELGETMFRFSLDFARLILKSGQFNAEQMETYLKILAKIKLQDQKAMLTLWHWPLPRRLVRYNNDGEVIGGGWEHPEANKYFRFYVENVLRYLADKKIQRAVFQKQGFSDEEIEKLLNGNLVNYIMTINEPSTFGFNSYVVGIFPPYCKCRVRFSRLKKVLNNLAQAHTDAFEVIKSAKFDKEVQVGLAHNWTYFGGVFGKFLQEKVNEKITKKFERQGQYSDFLALQYYCRATISWYKPLGPFHSKKRHYSDHPGFGDIYPEGIYHHLKRLHCLYPAKPIFITEFGVPDNTDTKRPYVIMETVKQIMRAKADGVPIKGILHWSLADNFEWEQGMTCKLGLFSEKDLTKPLNSDGDLHSWEVWLIISRLLQNPSSLECHVADETYEEAREMFFRKK